MFWQLILTRRSVCLTLRGNLDGVYLQDEDRMKGNAFDLLYALNFACRRD